MSDVPDAALELLYEKPGLPQLELPVRLGALYGGGFGFSTPRLVANFVAALDGVVAIPSMVQSNKLISGRSSGDRFVMALLRACADTVVIGSGTMRGSPRTLWTAEHAYPAAEAAFSELRRSTGLPPTPALAVVSASGALDVQHPALRAGALVLTTRRGAAALAGRLPKGTHAVVVSGGSTVDPRAAVHELRTRGARLILSEAGPRLFGSLVKDGLVDELFLTYSPLLAGRSTHQPPLSLVEDTALLPGTQGRARLLSVRRQADHLFLRYQLASATP